MVATRAQRAQTKDEPAPPKRGAMKEPARRGKKKVEFEEPESAPKPTRAATTKKGAKTAAKPAAPATRRTRAKDAEPPASEKTIALSEPIDGPEAEEEPVAPAPAKATRKTATKAAASKSSAPTTNATTTTTTTTRKRAAREIEPETARPAKRQTRSRAPAESDDQEQDEATEEPKAAPAAKRATRATRATGGTKASASRSATSVKPLAQRVTVTAKKQTRKAKENVSEPAVPEVDMEDAEEPPAPASVRSTRKSSRKAASEEHEEASELELEALVEPTPIKSAKNSSGKKALDGMPEAPAQEAETEDDVSAAAPVQSAEKTPVPAEKENEKPIDEPQAEQDASDEASAATPVQTPKAPQEQPNTPAKATPAPPKSVRAESKENVPPAKTPGPAHYTFALPFAQEATPFFRPEQAEKNFSLQARTPAFNKSLLHETPRKAPIGVSPFKLPPMSAAKPTNVEANTGSILNSPAKRAPFANSMHGMTPMRPSAANFEPKTSILQTPARKGLMLPPSTAPVNKQGFQPSQAKSSLLQTCPRKIALPGLPPRASMTSPTKTAEGHPGSSLLSATPRRVRIQSPAKPAFPSDAQDFAFAAQNSALGAEPRRWRTPVKTPAKRFGTPGDSLERSSDSDVGSPTPVKRTPAGLKDVNSALKMLHGQSPALPPATPTEQFVLNVIDKLDQSLSESESTQEEELEIMTPEIEVGRSADEPEMHDSQEDITADLQLQQPDADEMEQCVSPADLVMSDNESSAATPAAEAVEDTVMDGQTDAPVQDSVIAAEAESASVEETVQEAPQEDAITEEPSIIDQHEEYAEATPARPEIQFIEESHDQMEEEQVSQPAVEPAILQSTSELIPAVEEQSNVEEAQDTQDEEPAIIVETVQETVEETAKVTVVTEETEEPAQKLHDIVVTDVPERPSTPTMEEQHIATLAKEKAKTERRARHKRLSLAIDLERSIKKPRKSLAFIPSLTPAKSALRSPFKKPFGSPKKSVAWATHPAEPKIVEEPQQPATPQAATPQPVVLETEVDSEVNIPHPDDALLRDTVFFVDVRTLDGEDASDLFIPLLEEMGAKIVNGWSGIATEITHVLFKDGSIETLEKVAATHGAVKAVNIGWVLDCERFNTWVPEADYLIEISRLLGNSPARALTTLSAANTPLRPSSAKSVAYGTPFALMHLTPKAKATTLSPFADVTPRPHNNSNTPIEDKENTPQTQLFKTPTKASLAVTAAGEFSPSTPYFLHAQNIVQKTCPPKQQMKGLFERPVSEAEPAVTPFRQKMLLARHSLSPATFGRAQGL